jgi:Bacteriophage Mu Gp45 spike protein
MFGQSPLNAAFFGYTSGGCRSLVEEVGDDTGMQEMKGSFMQGEAREKVESPQNYGFSSVCRKAKKDKDGKIEECAEAYINFLGGNRSFPVAAVMDDRRHRPRGLKPGENSQYDDIGQMTLMRRNGLFLLSLDSEDPDEQETSGGGGGGATTREGESGGGQKKERMVSLRHVEKQKQPKPQKHPEGGGSDGGGAATTREGGSGGGGSSDFKHEGESVNTEVRSTKQKIEIFDGNQVVAVYNRQGGSWTFHCSTFEVEASGITLEAGRVETVGSTFLGLGSKGENGQTVMTIAGPAAATKAKV